MVTPAAPGGLQRSLAHWAYFALLRSSIRNSRLATLPLASLLCSLDFRFACFAHCARRSFVPLGARFVRPPPLPSSIRNGRSASSHRARLRRRGVPWLRTALRFVCSPLQPFRPPMCGPPLLIGLTTACFRHRRRPSCAPLQFPLKSYGFPGAETARKRFSLWKMGFSAAAYCEPMHPSIQHGRPTPSHRPALTLARCSAPADFASLRVLGAPAASRPPTLASSLVALPASLGLLRAVSPTGRALRAPPPYTPPGTIKVRQGFVPLFGFSTVCAALS